MSREQSSRQAGSSVALASPIPSDREKSITKDVGSRVCRRFSILHDICERIG